MENKYYTPELEEFCKGFEYEQLGPKNEWVKCTWDFHQFSEGRFLSLLHSPAWIRVKYLDKDDFFSLGFFERQQYPGVYCIGDDYSFYFHVGKWIAKKQKYVIFWGDIKNKSELKRLLTQLRIP